MQIPNPSALSRAVRQRACGTTRAGRGVRQAGWATVCAIGCTGAWAQNDPNPYYLGVSLGVTHNTNINSSTTALSDTSYSTGLIGGFNQPVGRQVFYGSGNVAYNSYGNYTQFNNPSYSANAGWNWETVGDLSGSLTASASQQLASLANNLLQQSNNDNLVRTQQIGTRANWGGNGRYTIGGGYGYSQTKYGDPSLLAADSNSQSADIGVYFHPGARLSLGAALRFTRSDTERAYLLADGTYLSNRTSGRNIDLSAQWTPTGLSSANARISWTDQTNAYGGDGYTGLTGGLGFTYAATGKITLNGAYNRDASTNGSFYNTFTGTTTTQPVVGLAANNSVSNSVSAGASYSATSKVSVTTNASYRRSTQEDGGGGVVGGNYRDSYITYSLGASWSIRRYWSLNCGVSHFSRRLSGTGVDNGDYSGNSYSCSTQVTIQ